MSAVVPRRNTAFTLLKKQQI